MKLKFLLIPIGIIYSISVIPMLLSMYLNIHIDWPANILLYLYLPMMLATWYLIIKKKKYFTWKNIQNNFFRTGTLVITVLYSLVGVICLVFYISNKFYDFNLEEEFVIFKFIFPCIIIFGYTSFPILLSASFWYLLLKEHK